MNNGDCYETSLFRLPRALANVWDVSFDTPLPYGFSITTSHAHTWGKDLVQSIYPAGSNAPFGYVKTNFHF